MNLFNNFAVIDHIPSWHWIVLLSWFTALLLIDILFLHRKDHQATLKESSVQSLVWIGLGVLLGIVFWLLYGHDAAGQYFSGYLIEKSLSIDNVFAWSVILTYFKIPKKYQFRVLFWGIFGALIMRAVFIFAGIAVLDRFEGVLLFFGGLLIFSGLKLLKSGDDNEFDPAKSKVLKFFDKVLPVTHKVEGHHFFIKINGKRFATMLFMALIAVEFTDVLFAVDSVPAILSVSREPIIVFASNAAAILGLRALYFVFDHIKDKFWLLSRGLGVLLMIVGVKMLIAPHEIFGLKWFGIEISTLISLVTIITFLTATIVLSMIIPAPKK